MLGVRESLGLSVISLLVTVTLSSSSDVSDAIYDRSYSLPPSPYDNRIQYLIESKRSISAIKRLVDDLENNFGKRIVCDIGGGMSASCNNKDLLEAMDHHRYLSSSFAPGRRRRRSLRFLFNNDH